VIMGRHNETMQRQQAVEILQAHERELRAAGIAGVSLFGSVARDESHPDDVDVVVRLNEGFSRRGLDYIGRLDDLEQRLSGILGCKVDVIEEPVSTSRLQQEIDRDRVIAF
jgi:predicted nucleotidyltransferase